MKTSEKTVKLGLMPPLTGLVGIYGSEIVHAAQVACKEINENGGVLGRQLEIIIEDDGSLPDSAVIAAKKLLDEHKCTAIIGNLLSNSRIAVAYSVAEPRKVPYLNFSFYEGSISSPYFFHFAALPNQQIDKMIPYMRNKFGPRMFFAGNNYEWPRGSIHAGKLALENVGGEVVGEEYTPIGVEQDVIEKLLDHVEAANPDVFVPYFAGSDQVLLLTRFTERGLKDRIAVVMGHYDEMMASQLSAEVRDGFYSSNTYFMTIDTEENKNYKSRLANLPDVDGVWPNGNGILTNFGEGTYVCVKAFAEAANQAGTLDSEALLEELEAISINAPQGLVEMNPEHHHAKVNTYLSQCDSNGVFNLIENFGSIVPKLPDRYRHQHIANKATLEDDIRLQARILEQMMDGVLLVSTADGNIVFTNAGAEKLFGYDKDEMIGLPITAINDPTGNEQNDTAEEIFRILNQTGEWQGEVRNIKKDGTLIWCSSSISTFTHPVYGEVWLDVQRDIDERKELSEKLKYERDFATALLNTTPMVVLLLDAHGYIKYANPYFEKLSGYQLNELIDKEWFSNFLPERDQNKIREFFLHSLHEESTNGNINPIVIRNGEEREIEWNSKVMRNLEGKMTGLLSVGQDVTERMKIDIELNKYRHHLEGLVDERTQELKDTQVELVRKGRLATLGQLTATVSHELRNPLGAMRPSLYIIEKISDKEDERLQEAIARIDRNIDRCDRIIDELLDFTRITELHKETARIDEWLESVVEEQDVPEGIKLEKDFSLNDFEIDIDSDRLRRAIINVFENGCHAMMDDNQQVVKDKNAHLKIKSTKKNGRVEIIISDTGSGISKEVLEKIYEPLFSTKGFGVGLGMPTVKQIMEQHGGGVDIESEEGIGTKVTLWLPIKSIECDREVEVNI